MHACLAYERGLGDLEMIDEQLHFLAAEEMVPLDLVDSVVGPSGLRPTREAVARSDCPVAPELLKEAE